MKIPLNAPDLINRIWLILAISIPLSYYLYSQNNDWFLASAFVGAVAIIHTERKADYQAWNDYIVLIAHMLAIVAIFGSVSIGAILFASGFDLNVGLTAIVILFIAGGAAAVAHNMVQDHFDNIRSKND